MINNLTFSLHLYISSLKRVILFKAQTNNKTPHPPVQLTLTRNNPQIAILINAII
jgi:hypothetical protein